MTNITTVRSGRYSRRFGFPWGKHSEDFYLWCKDTSNIVYLELLFLGQPSLRESRKTVLFVAINAGRVRDYCPLPAKTVADEGGGAPAGGADQLTASPCA